ncbi:MAG: membrane protein insertase YidC [Spirochaetota bacterium]
MDKKTIIAVIISVIVITAGFFIQSVLFPPKQESSLTKETEATTVLETPAAQKEQGDGGKRTLVATVKPYAEDEGAMLQEIQTETDVFDVTFSTQGGIIKSLKLKEHKDRNASIDMILRGEEDQGAFNIYFGDFSSKPMVDIFHYRRLDEYTFEFYKDFVVNAAGESPSFTLRKKYVFKPREYLFEVHITIENSIKEFPNLDFKGYAYTLGFGPQIGPEFNKLDDRQEYRKFYSFINGKRNNVKLSKEGIAFVSDRVSWVSIVGKYFTIIGIPDATLYDITLTTEPVPGLTSGAQMYFSRPLIKSSKNTDIFRFYAGPKTARILSRYDDAAKNDFSAKGLNLGKVMDSNVILGWLENILKFILVLFYKIIPNYGVAIILLTVLIKIILFPFTHKSYESTSRMQALNPKIAELREKYKNNPTKLNQEMAALYKKEGVNPLGGCLPLLLQMPVFFALYGLLNTHFDLRGAAFLPPWITDLSAPESIWNFSPFRLPILGWSDLRLLPILFVGSQILSSKLMQTPDGASGKQMQIITNLMPLIFFFILYDAPSGLLLYWTVTNILTLFQQYYSNYRRRKGAAKST